MNAHMKPESTIRLTAALTGLVLFLLTTAAGAQGMPQFQPWPLQQPPQPRQLPGQLPMQNDPLARDPVIRQARETVYPAPIASEADLDQAAQAYETLSYLLGRLDTRAGILRQSPEVLAEMQSRQETVSRYMASADQHVMVVPLPDQMQTRAVLSQGQNTLYSLYNAYCGEIRRIEERHNGLFRDMLVYLRDHRCIEDADATAGEIMRRGNVARLRGRADAGGTDRLYADAADFLNRFLMPMLESARNGTPAETPAEALAGLVEGLTAVAEGLVHGR